MNCDQFHGVPLMIDATAARFNYGGHNKPSPRVGDCVVVFGSFDISELCGVLCYSIKADTVTDITTFNADLETQAERHRIKYKDAAHDYIFEIEQHGGETRTEVFESVTMPSAVEETERLLLLGDIYDVECVTVYLDIDGERVPMWRASK